jgi:hypothetical protein
MIACRGVKVAAAGLCGRDNPNAGKSCVCHTKMLIVRAIDVITNPGCAMSRRASMSFANRSTVASRTLRSAHHPE